MKIEQRKVGGPEWGPQVRQTALLDSPIYTGQAQGEEKKHRKREARIGPPTWKGPYPIIFSAPSAVMVPGHDSWIHYSQVKSWKRTEESTQYTCEPLGALRYLFKTTNECHSNEYSQK